MARGRPMAKGRDPRRHDLTPRERSKAGFVTWWQYVFIHWDPIFWSRETRAAARRAWDERVAAETPW